MSTARDPGSDLDLMAAAAQTRLAAFINRTAAQQMRRMRESWDDELMAALSAPADPTTPSISAALHAMPHAIATPATTQAPYPWDDITALDDEAEALTTFDMVGIALQVATVAAFIFCTGFGLGYLAGGR